LKFYHIYSQKNISRIFSTTKGQTFDKPPKSSFFYQISTETL